MNLRRIKFKDAERISRLARSILNYHIIETKQRIFFLYVFEKLLPVKYIAFMYERNSKGAIQKFSNGQMGDRQFCYIS